MNATDQKQWVESAHERGVENFYGTGVEHYANFHNGYLNFGLWDNGITDYVKAAENLVHRMGTLLGLNEASKLLDVGSGMGTQDIYLFQNFAPQSIDSLDVTWKHVQHARRRAQEAQIEDRVRFHHGTATAMPFDDASFTHLLSIEAPEHFDTREKFLYEASRVLEPGGVIAISDYSLKKQPRTLLEKFLVGSARRLWRVPEVNVHSVEVYQEKMERAGFVNVEIEEVGASVIPGYYFEQRRPEVIKELTEIRGFVAGRLGVVIDVAVYQAFKQGLMEYILVRAEKGK
jgi:erythromycin 3''-O-methyltransferase